MRWTLFLIACGLFAQTELPPPLILNTANLQLPAIPTGTLIQIAAPQDISSRVMIDGWASIGTVSPNLTFRYARGTASAPAAVGVGDFMGAVSFWGYNGTAYTTNSKAQIRVTAQENWTLTANGTALRFLTAPNGSTTLTEQVTMGEVGYGLISKLTSRFQGITDVANNIPLRWEDSAGTASKILYLDNGNILNVGVQDATASNGDILFWNRGAARLKLINSTNASFEPATTGGASLGTTAATRWFQANIQQIYARGDGASGGGLVSFFGFANTDAVNIQAPAVVTNHTLTLPAAQGAANTFLKNNGSGILSWATGGSSPFNDNTSILFNNADNTKLLSFALGGFTTGTTRTLTPQNASYTIAGTNISNTFTSIQTLSASVLFGADATYSLGSSSAKANNLWTRESDTEDLIMGQAGTSFATYWKLSTIGAATWRLTTQSGAIMWDYGAAGTFSLAANLFPGSNGSADIGGTVGSTLCSAPCRWKDLYLTGNIDISGNSSSITMSGTAPTISLAAGSIAVGTGATFTQSSGTAIILTRASVNAIRIDASASGGKITTRDGSGTIYNQLDPSGILSIALKTTGSAGGKNVVCVDTSTGQLYASSTGTDCSN